VLHHIDIIVYKVDPMDRALKVDNATGLAKFDQKNLLVTQDL
jgi:hypothetical protein